MIVWSGRGILPVIVLFISMVLFVKILPEEQGDWSFVFSFFLAAAFSWFMGKKWNERKTVVDEGSGQEYQTEPNHSLFFIKMQYWGPIFAVLGIVILVQQFV